MQVSLNKSTKLRIMFEINKDFFETQQKKTTFNG